MIQYDPKLVDPWQVISLFYMQTGKFTDIIIHSGLSLACLFVWFDSLRPSQQFFNYVGTGLQGLLKDTKQWRRWGSKPSVLSQVLYHWATELRMNIHEKG